MALGRAYVQFGFEYPSQYRHLFMVQRTVSEEALAQKPPVDAYEILIRAVRAAIDAGELHPSWSDPELVGRALKALRAPSAAGRSWGTRAIPRCRSG